MKQKEIIYGISGLVLGVLLTVASTSFHTTSNMMSVTSEMMVRVGLRHRHNKLHIRKKRKKQDEYYSKLLSQKQNSAQTSLLITLKRLGTIL